MRPIHENAINLTGRLCDDLTSLHSINGKTCYNGTVIVQRQSGAVDHLPVSFYSDVCRDPFPLRGKRVRIIGEIRTYTRNDERVGHRHLVTVWAKEIWPTAEPDGQTVSLEGVICKPPVYRVTPLGREICDLLVAVDRQDGASYIPVVAWGMNAKRMSRAQVGDVIRFDGRFQSRKYTKKLEVGCEVERTAYEISAKTCRVIGMQRKLVAQ